MIRWFLALFPQYRDLQVQLEVLRGQLRETEQQQLLAQDRLEMALNDRSRVWDVLKDALDHERAAYRMQLNVEFQKQYGTAPFPDDFKLPERSLPKDQGESPRITGHRSPSDAVRARTELTKQALLDKWTGQDHQQVDPSWGQQ